MTPRWDSPIAVALEPFWTRRHQLAAVGPLAALLALDADVDQGSAAARSGSPGCSPARPRATCAATHGWRRARRWPARSGDDEGAAWALKGLGRLAVEPGRLDAARAAYEESLALFEQLGLAVPASGRLGDLAYLARAQRRFARHAGCSARASELERAAGDVWSVAGDFHNLGDIELEAGDPAAALAAYRDAIEAAAASTTRICSRTASPAWPRAPLRGRP